MQTTEIRSFVETTWDESITPKLIDYIRIPNKSPLYDPDWREHGYMDRAVELVADWCREQPLPGMTVEIVRIEGRTPLIYAEIPGDVDDTVLLYGHYDKQPEMVGWSEDLGPWTPVLRGEKLYGRGGADDGYAAFASLTAVRALHEQRIPHARCVVLIEGCEESGSYDLPYYMDLLADRIGTPSLVVCLDSGCGNYDQLWCTTSLRGNVVGNLTVEILKEGVHSGDASGVVPSSFRILRQLLSRIEDETTGRILPEDLHVEIPPTFLAQAQKAAAILGGETHSQYAWVDGAGPVSQDPEELILNRTWRPTLSYTGMGGIPSLDDAGNVLRPETAIKLSFRLPPTTDTERAAERIKSLLESDPPYGAHVCFEAEKGGQGWCCPEMAPWLLESVQSASRGFFDRDVAYIGEGGSIPFMGMLGRKFPDAQFLITGLLGPQSNAHGPNEFLHLPMGKKLTACVSKVLADHGGR